MLTKINIGDYVICTKDVYFERKLIFKKSNQYYIDRVYKNYKAQDAILILSKDDNSSCLFIVDPDNVVDYDFNLHFVNIKKIRKEKIKKILKYEE
jgi:hypothetical protein